MSPFRNVNRVSCDRCCGNGYICVIKTRAEGSLDAGGIAFIPVSSQEEPCQECGGTGWRAHVFGQTVHAL